LDTQAPGVLRAMPQAFIAALMGAEADALRGAPYGEVTQERANRRNGRRHRPFGARVGTLDVAIPKLREGSCYPDWLPTPCRRAEKALTSVIAASYLLGVSTRRVERLAEALGVGELSKSRVSGLAKSLDAEVAAFRGRPLGGGPHILRAGSAR
jgi:putative transposase